jgi:hypothetical protein
MTQHGVGPATEHARQPAPVIGQRAVPDGVDAAVHAVQSAGADLALDA